VDEVVEGGQTMNPKQRRPFIRSRKGEFPGSDNISNNSNINYDCSNSWTA
jgi:hypothetical protein